MSERAVVRAKMRKKEVGGLSASFFLWLGFGEGVVLFLGG